MKEKSKQQISLELSQVKINLLCPVIVLHLVKLV